MSLEFTMGKLYARSREGKVAIAALGIARDRLDKIAEEGTATADEIRALARLATEMVRERAVHEQVVRPISRSMLNEWDLNQLRRRYPFSWAVVVRSKEPTLSTDVHLVRINEHPGHVGEGHRLSNEQKVKIAIGCSQPTRAQARILRDQLCAEMKLKRVTKRDYWDPYMDDGPSSW